MARSRGRDRNFQVLVHQRHLVSPGWASMPGDGRYQSHQIVEGVRNSWVGGLPDISVSFIDEHERVSQCRVDEVGAAIEVVSDR